MSLTQSQADVPIACNLTETEQRERRETEVADMFRVVKEVRELEDGYAFSFAPSEALAFDLLNFVLFERKCCPFFTFELVFDPTEGPIWLRLRGAEGVKEFVREAFGTSAMAPST